MKAEGEDVPSAFFGETMYEITMNLDLRSTKTLYEQIYEYIRDEIRKGTLKCGERLPSTRLLASHLDVSRSTAQLAYEQLLSEGYIEAIPCKGYFVCQMEALYRLDRLLIRNKQQCPNNIRKYIATRLRRKQKNEQG